jgi:N-methylhydantoinase B
MQSDPVQLEIIKNALESIADGMALTVVRTSRSSVVRQALDFSTALLSPSAELIAQGMCVPMHLGGMGAALQRCLDRYDGQVHPGDILINNDPYEGGSHLPDIFCFKPVFQGDILIGYLCSMTHHTDIGGRVAGGNACDSTEIYQEGLRIPPLKLYNQGQPNETLFRIIEKAVRVPEKVLGDLSSQVAALYYGERELLHLVNRFGVENLVRQQAELLDYTEVLTRRAIRQLPDGEWHFTDYVDDDGFDPGPIAIAVHLTKHDDEIYLDFAGTSPQCKGAINPVFDTTKSMCYAVVRTVLGNSIPNTGGYFRPLHVTAPEGSFVNPVLPAPVAARALACYRESHALFGVFAQMLPDKLFAAFGSSELGIAMAGYDKTKQPWENWVQLDFQNETCWGGFADRDGADAQGTPTGNQTIIPVETIEAENPIMFDAYGFVTDSEGAGKFRGGMGMIRTYRYLMDETMVQMRSDRMKHPPYGLFGGHSSGTTKITITEKGQSRSMPSKFMTTLNSGDSLEVSWPGGGGFGQPLERDTHRVLADVIAELVTVQKAKDVYGVIIDAQRRMIDEKATIKLRKAMKKCTIQAPGN